MNTKIKTVTIVGRKATFSPTVERNRLTNKKAKANLKVKATSRVSRAAKAKANLKVGDAVPRNGTLGPPTGTLRTIPPTHLTMNNLIVKAKRDIKETTKVRVGVRVRAGVRVRVRVRIRSCQCQVQGSGSASGSGSG